MGHKKREKRERTIRDLARERIPDLLNRFLCLAPMVVDHPRRVRELHAMRLKGKGLRYLMESTAFAFGEQFDGALQEVKRLLVLMGRVHDCDIHIPRARTAVADIRRYNGIVQLRDQRIPLPSLTIYLVNERRMRGALFQEVCGILKRWNAENFPESVRRSMFYPPFV